MIRFNRVVSILIILLILMSSCRESTTKNKRRIYEVFGTSNDYRAPWLALREAPDSDSLLLQKLTDGTQLIILENDSSSNWVKVQMVVSEGYVNKKWLRKMPAEAERKRANFGDFAKAMANFREILQNKDAEKLQDFINPETGFLILKNPGLFTFPFYYDSIAQVKDKHWGYSEIFKNDSWDCMFQKGSRSRLKINSRNETARWDKTGCYWNETKTADFSNSEYQAQRFETGGMVSMDTIKMIEAEISHELMSTETFQVFYFGSDGYFWYLYGINLTVVMLGEVDLKILN